MWELGKGTSSGRIKKKKKLDERNGLQKEYNYFQGNPPPPPAILTGFTKQTLNTLVVLSQN